MNLAEQFMHDKETLLELYLDVITKLKYDFKADDIDNGFGAYRRYFNSDLISPTAHTVGRIITSIIKNIEKSIKTMFANILESTGVIRRYN